MKQYEELARLRVEEAIQAGLRSQSAQRALSENKLPATSASLKKSRQHEREETRQRSWFILLLNSIINIAR